MLNKIEDSTITINHNLQINKYESSENGNLQINLKRLKKKANIYTPGKPSNKLQQGVGVTNKF